MTLLEVMVALAVFAIAGLAVMKTASEHLSGLNYLDAAPFDERKIAVTYHEFSPQPYPQQDGDFIGGLSILDHWANCGPTPWWK